MSPTPPLVRLVRYARPHRGRMLWAASLESSQIVESDTHDELVEFDGACAGLWRVQTGSAIGATNETGLVAGYPTWEGT